ncbi:MAG: histone family [Gammaproteobacteria bacterium]|jgi:DNA-binding protein H-NS|nr:histone family [Gammaproteobacteria bacterium]
MDELEQIQQQIIALQQKADEIAKQNRSAVIEDIKAKIKAYSLTTKDLGLVNKGTSLKSSPVAVKYKQGEDTWTGRGRQPKWIADYVAKGGQLDKLLIK